MFDLTQSSVRSLKVRHVFDPDSACHVSLGDNKYYSACKEKAGTHYTALSMIGWLAGWLLYHHKQDCCEIAALVLSKFEKKWLKTIFYCKKLKYTINYGLCHISIKTVSSPSCAGLKEPAASWRASFDNGVNKMVIVMK